MGWTSRDFGCSECGDCYADTVQYEDMDKTPCRTCGNILTVLISVPRIQKKEIEMRTHGAFMTPDGKKLIQTDKKSEAMVKAQWEAKKAIQEAKRAGNKEAAAEATRDLAMYVKEGMKDIGKDKPAQSAEYNGKKIQ